MHYCLCIILAGLPTTLTSRTRSITVPGHACGPASRDSTSNASFPLSSCERLAAWKSTQWFSLAPHSKHYGVVLALKLIMQLCVRDLSAWG